MQVEHLRNIAIIAHVDHGKTTLVDKLLRATDAFRSNQQIEERVLDSNDQERERGITILAKNCSIEYKGVKINVIDTPGHADFGGEVERVLKMADGALLLVDAFEGPMPQTRFVLRHAIDTGLRIMIVINKIDRPAADPERAYNDCLDLMADLGATDEQLEFAMEHVVYASAVNGYARRSPEDDNNDMFPLLDMIIDDMPAPEVDECAPLAMQCVTIDHSNFVGRIGIGRVFSGTLHEGDTILVQKNDGTTTTSKIKQLFTFDYLGRTECSEVGAGDIAAVVGVEGADIGDVYTDPEHPVELAPILIDPPTLSVVFEASTSPLVGRDGDTVGARQLKERLLAEADNNVTMRIAELEDKSGVEVSGRGILHLSVLMETMRREGFEFQVARPRVLFRTGEDGKRQEPIEQAVVECPDEYSGKVIEVFGNAGGTMTSMQTGVTVTHLEFRIPTRGIMGLKNRILNVTHGEGVFYHTFLEYGPYAGEIGGRNNGAMISMTTEKAVAYALGTLQERGQLFVEPGTECYEGMLVGERNKPGDMVVNIARTKNLGNQRSSTSDISVQLTPPRTFSLEEALEYIADDELVEITPKNVRLRKRLLSANERKKAAVRRGQ
ncbi:GTP-binding protein TypA [Coriobacterium glomerans PW2]|uniref:Large ribosomal subunit assembly factor BipA n=1 Tax=Coriobacterium glomerans (strain ATCC 49209 / DSM 20642 / JCM 10262 / PW2) TaxID=700015 RepID=F2N9D2_CORGP|nr:translational GTPase TypA [Coriobacterium glomerans]AEB07880.1 GTP-binding protein TypA [Coriobacterium glomerans PW2]